MSFNILRKMCLMWFVRLTEWRLIWKLTSTDEVNDFQVEVVSGVECTEASMSVKGKAKLGRSGLLIWRSFLIGLAAGKVEPKSIIMALAFVIVNGN